MDRKILRLGWVLIFTLTSLGAVSSTPMSAISADLVDLEIELKAPQHVAPDSEYIVNLAYSNLGTEASPDDAWLKVRLPEGVVFVSAVDQAGDDLAPGEINGNELTWLLGAIPPVSCCQHIFIRLQVGGDLAEETALQVEGEIGSGALESDFSNNLASITSLVCEMAGSGKMVNAGEVKPGDALTYTIQLRLSQRTGIQEIEEREVSLVDSPQFQHQVRFLGWVGAEQGTWDGNILRWRGRVRAGETLTLQYRFGVEGDVPPGAIIRNTATVEWDGQSLQLGPVESVVTMPQYAWMVGPLGYAWKHASGVEVDVPPESVPEPTRFEFQWMYTAGPPDSIPAGYVYANRAMELNAFRFGEIHEFDLPIAVSVDVDPALVNQFGRERLIIRYRNQTGEPWLSMGPPTWVDEDTLVFTTDHLTQFALFAASTFRIHLPYIRR